MERIKLFISWAGDTSRPVGEAMHEWLPLLFDYRAVDAIQSWTISTLPSASLFRVLHGVEYADVTLPLSMFNHTRTVKEDDRKLVESLNQALENNATAVGALSSRFDAVWPILSQKPVLLDSF
jgi:hypothetical protein